MRKTILITIVAFMIVTLNHCVCAGDMVSVAGINKGCVGIVFV